MVILMKYRFTFLLLFLVSITFRVNAQIPRSENLFDDGWKFFLGNVEGAEQPEFNDASWRDIDLPHDWSIEGEVNPQNPTGNDGGYFPAGIGWYRKTFMVPSDWNGKHVSIYFEGVYMNSEVFINGKSLGIHPYGYTSFYYNLTPYLKIDQENVIAVLVDNSQQKNSRWYSGSGIYRHVRLFVKSPIHIDQWGVAITTPVISEKETTVRVKTLVKNGTKLPQSIILSTQLSYKNTVNAGNDELKIELPANETKEVIQTITVNKPMLWSPETPNLYDAQIKLSKDDETIDQINNSFGIRSISFSAENGFQLNGEKIILNGGCVHHDNGCLGAAAYDRAEERKVELLKSAGFNAVRTAHNPPSEAFLDACDRLGLLVIDESFDGWRESKTPYDYAQYFDDWWQRDIEAMVLRDRNHPSIIIWSIGNEIIERTDPEAVETAKMLAGAIKKYDPTRPITSAMTTWNQGWEIFDPLMAVHDICGYNYQLQHAPDDHKRVPSRIILNTESYPRDAFYVWDMVNKHNYIIGDFVWTAMDYLGEAGIGAYYYPGEQADEHWQSDRYPWFGAYCGDIDMIGWRKPISHYRSMLYNDKEKLYMAVREPNPEKGEIKLTSWAVWPAWESWTWLGHEGKDIQVEVYSKYPKVQIYLNDKFIGEKQTGKDEEFKAIFTLPYAPGLIKAVGMSGDKEMETTILQTAGEPSKIKLTADRSKIKADRNDLAYIKVEITDDQGYLVPNAVIPVTFNVSGVGEIAGSGNGCLNDIESINNSFCKTFHGQALVVLRPSKNDEVGTMTLRADANGLATGELNIIVE